jgi:hypothetical protein
MYIKNNLIILYDNKMTTATKNIRYDTDLLRQICERDKCTVDFDKIEKPYL